MSEKVIVVGINEDGFSFAKCVQYKDDVQLENEVCSRFGCNDFQVFYDENIDELEDALEAYYAASSSGSLTDDDKECIRLMMDSGDFSQKEVANSYGVCRQTIWKICKES